jgi:hypothetical protein
MATLPVVGKAHEAAKGDDFVWFLYASSLDAAAFQAWCAQHGYVMPDLSRATPGTLSGFRLSFDVQSRFWGGAVASLSEDPAGKVEGLLLPLPGSAKGLVEHKEGAISGLYVPFEASVTPTAGGPAVAARVFRAAPDRRLPHDEAPSRTFLQALIQGARASHLSKDYVAGLEARLKSLG